MLRGGRALLCMAMSVHVKCPLSPSRRMAWNAAAILCGPWNAANLRAGSSLLFCGRGSRIVDHGNAQHDHMMPSAASALAGRSQSGLMLKGVAEQCCSAWSCSAGICQLTRLVMLTVN
jgi:hypothetical protein